MLWHIFKNKVFDLDLWRAKYFTNHKILLLLLIQAFFLCSPACYTPQTKPIEIQTSKAALEEKKQRILALELLLKDWNRLNRISYKIMSKAVDLCEGKIRPRTGIYFANRYSFGENFAGTSHSLGLSEPLQVFQVIESSPVKRAGIRKGDILVSINGLEVSSGEGAHQKLNKKLKTILQSNSPVSIKVVRNQKEILYDVLPEPLCDSQIKLDTRNDIVNALADGENIVVTRGMVQFVEDDIELAYIISHELAHNVRGHINAKRANAIPGIILDLAVYAIFSVHTGGFFSKLASTAYSKSFETEADYVGLYMAALSGADIKKAPKFWRRMAAFYPEKINTNFLASHPPTPERFLALQKTVEEIQNKIASGRVLKPEMKE